MDKNKIQNYPVVDKEEDADACAWIFTSKHSFKKQFIKLPDLKSNEIRARVLYTSVCHTDTAMGRGEWGDVPYPFCPGHEVVAKVMCKGTAVDNLEVGDVIGMPIFPRGCETCRFCKIDWQHACENLPFEERFIHYYRYGGFATHIQQPAKYCVKIPQGIDIKNAPPLMCAGITVYTPMSLVIKPDDKVAILGFGGLGHLALQFAKVMAKEVTVITHTEDKVEDIKALKADHVILEDDFVKNTPDFEFDVIIHTLPIWPKKEIVRKWLDSLNYFGRLVVLGVNGKNEHMEIDASALALKSNVVVSSCAGGKAHLTEMLDFCVKHKIECVTEHYDFDDFDKALERIEKEHPKYRSVIDAEPAALRLEAKMKA